MAWLQKIPKSNHGEGVETAVFVELIVDLGFTFWSGVWADGFLIGFDGHVAVLDAIKIAVVEVRADGWEHCFDAPTAV